MLLNKEELLSISGGAVKWNATFFNALARCAETLLDLGRSLGSAIRRIGSNNLCPVS